MWYSTSEPLLVHYNPSRSLCFVWTISGFSSWARGTIHTQLDWAMHFPEQTDLLPWQAGRAAFRMVLMEVQHRSASSFKLTDGDTWRTAVKQHIGSTASSWASVSSLGSGSRESRGDVSKLVTFYNIYLFTIENNGIFLATRSTTPQNPHFPFSTSSSSYPNITGVSTPFLITFF